jgi:uncharacterized membrane protein YdjX (TVP38/TMEM64 family)
VGPEPGPESSGGERDPAATAGAPIDRVAIAMTLGAIALGAVVVLLVPDLRAAVGDAIGGDTESLEDELRGLGAGGVVILYGLIFVHTVVWYPAEIVDAAGGFVYGFWGGLLLVHTGWIAQGVLAWWIGRKVAREPLRRLLGAKRFDDAERFVIGGGVTFLLAMRLIPIIPFSLFSYVAGAAGVRLWPFVWTTAVGYLPITALFIYLGSQLDSLSPTDPLLLGGAVLLVLLLALARPVSRKMAAARKAAREDSGA